MRVFVKCGDEIPLRGEISIDGWNGHPRLARNQREIKKIEISKEGDGAFAVVDIDTLWIDRNDGENHWKGRTCKVYSKIGDEWKMTMQTGVLDYS